MTANTRSLLAGMGSILDLSGNIGYVERETEAIGESAGAGAAEEPTRPTADRSAFANPVEALAWAVKTFREIQEHRRRNFGFNAGWWR